MATTKWYYLWENVKNYVIISTYWRACDWGVGDWGVGDWRVGDWRVGDWWVGDWRVGDWRVGDWRVGDLRMGHWRMGDWRVGDWGVAEWHLDILTDVDSLIWLILHWFILSGPIPDHFQPFSIIFCNFQNSRFRRTDRRTDRPMDRLTDGRTHPLIES